MNVRKIVVLPVLLCATASMVGMGRLGNSTKLAARNGACLTSKLANKNVARLASSKNDIAGPFSETKILGDGQGSIAVCIEKDASAHEVIYTNRFSRSIITGFYMRGSQKQYAFLANYSVFNCLMNLERIEGGIREGVDICTKNGEGLERLMAFIVTSNTTDRELARGQRNEVLTLEDAVITFRTLLELTLHRTADANNVIGDVTIADMQNKNSTIGFALDSNPVKSVYFESEPGRLIKQLNELETAGSKGRS